MGASTSSSPPPPSLPPSSPSPPVSPRLVSSASTTRSLSTPRPDSSASKRTDVNEKNLPTSPLEESSLFPSPSSMVSPELVSNTAPLSVGSASSSIHAFQHMMTTSESLHQYWLLATSPVEHSSTSFQGKNFVDESFRENPFDEMQVLEGHEDRIHCVVRLRGGDGQHIATGCDGGRLVIWRIDTGEQTLAIQAHSAAITSILELDQPYVATTSMDKTIAVWNWHTGALIASLEDHHASVKVIAWLDGIRLCSAGNGDDILMWDGKFGLNGSIRRHSSDIGETVSNLLPLSHSRLVTTSSSSDIYVYDYRSMGCIGRCSVHRDAIMSLCTISPIEFLTGSADGMVVYWSSWIDAIQSARDGSLRLPRPIRCFNYFDEFNIPNQPDPFAVTAMLGLGDHIVAFTSGKSIAAYDVRTGDLLFYVPSAHNSTIRGLSVTHDCQRFVTCSDEATIRVWDIAQQRRYTIPSSERPSSCAFELLHATVEDISTSRPRTRRVLVNDFPELLPGRSPTSDKQVETYPHSNKFESNDTKDAFITFRHMVYAVKSSTRIRHKQCVSCLAVGDLFAHTVGRVEHLLALAPGAFLSAGEDGLIVLWKDGRVERQCRDLFAAEYEAFVRTRNFTRALEELERDNLGDDGDATEDISVAETDE